jgi:peptidoglycan hydrolase CwlO-like protein
MRKVLVIVLAIAVVALAAFGISLNKKFQKSTADNAALQMEQQETNNRYGQAISEIAAIQDSLNAVSTGDEGTQALATQLGAEKTLSQDRSARAIARIAVIKAGVERAKGQIKDLDARLKKSGLKIAGLEKMITNLRQTVAEKEATITQLTERVGVLETKVTGLTTEVEQGHQVIQTQTATIEEKRRELGTVYYTIGSKKELIAAGLAVSKGGILGIRKTLIPTGQNDETRFTPLDTDTDTVIRIPSLKARVLTPQPASSYELTLVGDQTELHILDAKAFRTVKHVIIVTE